MPAVMVRAVAAAVSLMAASVVIVAPSPQATPIASAVVAPVAPGDPEAAGAPLVPVNIIDTDDRDSLLALGPRLGLSAAEIAQIRTVSGYVGCLSPSPSAGSGTLFLTDRQVITAAHILIEPSGRRRSKCFFKNQAPSPVMIDLLAERARFGSAAPAAGSGADFAVVPLVEPVRGARPLAVAPAVPVVPDEALVVVTAHPADLPREIDLGVPVVQPCRVMRVLPPAARGEAASFRTDCDATGSSSGGMNLARVGGRLTLRGITVTTGPWRLERLRGAAYSERRGSFTTALMVSGPVIAAGGAAVGADDATPAAGRSAPIGRVPLPLPRPRGG